MSALKYVLGISGAALLYEWYTGGLSKFINSTPVIAPNGSAQLPSSNVPGTSGSGTQPLNLPSSASLIAAASADGYTPVNQAAFNVYQWNYYYSKVTGKDNSQLFIGSSSVSGTSVPGSADTYLSWLGNWSSGLKGLGMIISLGPLYFGDELGSGFGEKEFSALSGLEAIVDDSTNNAAYIDEGPFNEAAMNNGSCADGNVNDFLLAASGRTC